MEDRPATVLFPTPPFADETAMTFLTSLIARFCGRPRWKRGIVPDFGRPWDVLVLLVSQVMRGNDLREGSRG